MTNKIYQKAQKKELQRSVVHILPCQIVEIEGCIGLKPGNEMSPAERMARPSVIPALATPSQNETVRTLINDERNMKMNSMNHLNGAAGLNAVNVLNPSVTEQQSETDADTTAQDCLEDSARQLALLRQQIEDAHTRLEQMSQPVAAEPSLAIFVRDPRAQAGQNRWRDQYHAVRAERDEYYARLLKISRGEMVDNPAAAATIPIRESTSQIHRNSMAVAEEIARERTRIASMNRVEIDFFKDCKRREPENQVEEGQV